MKVTTLLVALLLGISTQLFSQGTADTLPVPRTDSTLFEYLAALDARPDDVGLLLKVVEGYLDIDEYEKAMPYALKAQQLDGQNADAHFLVGILNFYLGKYAFAVEALRKSFGLKPDTGVYGILNYCRLLTNTKDGVLNENRDFALLHSFNIEQMVAWAQDSSHTYYHVRLKQKFNQDWSSLGIDEFFMLYFAQSVQPEYSPYGLGLDFVSDIKKHYSAKEYDKVIELGEKHFEANPLNIDINWYLGRSYFHTKQYDKFEKHHGIYNSLMYAISATGDGNSAKTAYIVMVVHDEYEMLDFLGYRSSGQALISENGHSFDVLTAKDVDTGDEYDLYFNIDRPFGSLANMFKDVDLNSKKGKKKKK